MKESSRTKSELLAEISILKQKNKELEANHKRVEEELRENEEFAKSLFANSYIPLIVMNAETGIYIDCNAAAVQIYGYASREDVLGKTPLDVSAPIQYNGSDSATEVQKHNKIGREKGSHIFEWRHQRPNGQIWDAYVHLMLLQYRGKSLIQFMLQDITERKRMERALKESERRLTDLIDFLPDATFAIDHSGKVIAWNRAMEEMTGVKTEDVLGKGDYKYAVPFHGTPRPMLIDQVMGVAVADEKKYAFVKREGNVLLAEGDVTLRGAPYTIWGKAGPLYDSKGNIAGAIESVRDVTELKKAREELEIRVRERTAELVQANKALRKSEEKFRGIYEESPIGIELYDRKGTLLDVNRACLDIFGISDANAVKGLKLFHNPNLSEGFKAQLRRGRSVRLEMPYDFGKVTALNLYDTTKKEIIYLDVLITPLRGVKKESDIGYLVHTRDITKRKQAEEALQESEKQVRRKLDAILSPEGDIGTLELSDIIDTEKIQKLMDEFFDLTNLPMTIIDLKGKVLVGIGWQDICTHFHRVNPESCRLCIESDLELTSNVPIGTFKKYRCKNNMWDIATPIMLGDKSVGNIFMGQFLFDDEKPDYETFRQQARKYGFDEREYIAALERVPRWSKKTINKAMSFFTILAGIIGNLGYSNIKLANALEERKRAEEAVRNSEEKFRGIYEESPIGIELYDRKGTLLNVNRACLDIFGIAYAKELKGFKLFENHNLSEEFKAQLRRGRSVRHEMPFDFERIRSLKLYKTTKRGIIYLDVLITPLRGDKKESDIGYLVHTRDITERKQAEKALRESETKYRRLHESMTEAYARVDMNGRIQETNRAYQSMLGYSEEELRHLTYSDITPEKWHAFEKSVVEEQILVRGYAEIYEKEYQRKDGSVFPIELSTFLIRNDAGNPAGLWSIVRDITERKRAEAVLKESEEKYNQFFKTSRDCVFITSKDGRIIDLNDAAVELFGYSSREELRQVNFQDLYADPKDHVKHISIIAECGSTREYPVDFRRKDGSIRCTLVTSAARCDTNGNLIGVQGTVRDVTEQRRNEEELRKYREDLEASVSERTSELEGRTKNLQEVNTTLSVLLQKREEDKNILEERFVANIGGLVLPYVEMIKKNNLDAQQQLCLDIIEKNLGKIITPLLKNIRQFNLTPREVQVASLIKDGKTTKEIANILGIAKGSIDTHRKNIRKKLGLDRTSNLQSNLRFLEK
jgi:PAS domain S-box-containing protein